MSRRVALGLGLAAFACARAARGEASQPVELRRLFPQEAEVLAAGDGLSRLVLPPGILTACRPDLSDLRLFDSRESEVPFLVDAGAGAAGGLEVTRRFEPRVLDAARAEIRREDGPPLRRETIEIDLPATGVRGGPWVLIVEPRHGEFVARVGVEGIDAAGGATRLIEGGSVFRIAGGRAAEKLRLPLPAFNGPRLRIVLETEHPFWLEPALRLESARSIERAGTIAVPLEVLSVRTDAGRTVVDLARPRGIVPGLLRIDSSTRTFDRRVEVWDDGPAGGGSALATGPIFRVEGLVPVGEQDLALRPARGDRLRVEIDDGDSPPLEHLAFSAVVAQPSLIFSKGTGHAGEVFGTLRFGGGRARAPRYDLAGLLPAPARTVTGKRAEAAIRLYDPATVRPARLGAIRPNAAYDGAPALGFAMHPGARVDRRLFSHQRALAVPSSTEGLSRLRIEPADLAVLSDDLSDLRVADEASRQWPYLVEREGTTDLVPLQAPEPKSRDGTSRYALRLPVTPMRFDRLILDTGVAFFDRGFRLEAKSGSGGETTLLRGRLARPVGDPRPLSIDVPPVRVTSIDLVIEDGDDAPLPFRSAQVRVVLPEVFLMAPEGRYALLLGAPDHDAPRYELERVRDVVLAVQAAPIEAGPLQDNPEYSLNARLRGKGYRQTALLWAALSAAVVVLVILTLRLARRESSPAA
ncbi:MAG TPA: hypothetical protein VGV60_05390 [Candidatus Polarisedimenticolia bacterium]|nr:hypothetical protein [Candidatus Polarisedimenticolia bacterium]